MTMTSIMESPENSELEEGEIPDDRPPVLKKGPNRAFTKTAIHSFLKNSIGLKRTRRRSLHDTKSSPIIAEVILSSDDEYKYNNDATELGKLSANSDDEDAHKKTKNYQYVRNIMSEIDKTAHRKRHRRRSWRDIKTKRCPYVPKKKLTKCSKRKTRMSSDEDDYTFRSSRKRAEQRGRNTRDFDEYRKKLLENLTKTGIVRLEVENQSDITVVDMADDSDMCEDCEDAEVAVQLDPSSPIAITDSVDTIDIVTSELKTGGGEEEDCEEEELSQLRLLALQSNKIRLQPAVEEARKSEPEVDEMEEYKNEFLLRAEALKTAVLRKHSMRLKRQSPKKPELDSTNAVDISKFGIKLKSGLNSTVGVSEVPLQGTRAPDESLVEVMSDCSASANMTEATLGLKISEVVKVKTVSDSKSPSRVVEVGSKVIDNSQRDVILADNRSRNPVERVKIESNFSPRSLYRETKATNEPRVAQQQVSSRKARRRSRKRRSEQGEEIKLRNQLLSDLQTKKEANKASQIKMMEGQARKTPPFVPKKPKLTGPAAMKPIPVPAVTKRIIVHLGEDSSDGEEEPIEKTVPSAEVRLTYERSVELLLAKARQTAEMKMSAAGAGAATAAVQSTPEAVYKHLPPSQRLEYMRLKQKIAERERLKTKPSEQATEPSTSTKVPPKKPSPKKTHLFIQKKSEQRKLEAIKQRNRQLKIDNLKGLLKKIRIEKIIEEKHELEMKKLRNQMNLVEKKIIQQKTKIRKMVDDSKAIYHSIQTQDGKINLEEKRTYPGDVNKPEGGSREVVTASTQPTLNQDGGAPKVGFAPATPMNVEEKPCHTDRAPAQDTIPGDRENGSTVPVLESSTTDTRSNGTAAGIAGTLEDGLQKLKQYKSPLQPVQVGAIDFRLDPNVVMCQFDLTGTCRDEECPFQHYRS